MRVRPEHPFLGFHCALEDRLFDTNVIVKVLDIPRGGQPTAKMRVQRRRGMRRQRRTERLAESVRLQESGNAHAPRSVGLQYVHCVMFQHPAKIGRVVAVLAGGDLHACRTLVPNQL